MKINTKLCSLFIFSVVFLVYLFSKNITSFDSKWSIYTTLSIINEGNIDLNEYKDILESNNYFSIKEIDGKYYTWFPVGVSIIALPFVLIINTALKLLLTFPCFQTEFSNFVSQLPYPFINIIEEMIASIIVALCCGIIFLILNQKLHSKVQSILLTFIFAFCTSSWSTASRGLWQHGPSMLMLTIALYLIQLSKNNPRLIQYVSLPLAFSYIIRPTNSIPIFFLTIFVLLNAKRYFFRYLLWGVIIIAPFIVFNLNVYHAILSPYYLPSRIGVSSCFFEAFVGNILSPARGLFIYSPILLFFVYGVFLKIKQREFKNLDFALLSIIILHWITISSFPHWWAGHSFGSRFFSDVIPFFVYFLIPVVPNLFKLKGVRKYIVNSVFICLMLISFFIHYQGANNWNVFVWNSTPVNVDKNPERIWDWKDIQFLRGIH